MTTISPVQPSIAANAPIQAQAPQTVVQQPVLTAPQPQNLRTPKKYPVTYSQHVGNSMIGSAVGSSLLGLITLGMLTAFKVDAKNARKSSMILSGIVFGLSVISGLNGKYNLSYERRKAKFEQTA